VGIILFKEATMGSITKLQVIQRGQKNRQFYFICPAPLAEALELEKGEEFEWIVKDNRTLILKRASAGTKHREGINE
jgi:bifunctional DNA-binding transcriptional regulator/antitoxin component of YhaV-PrlF toxin-antitoxin module